MPEKWSKPWDGVSVAEKALAAKALARREYEARCAYASHPKVIAKAEAKKAASDERDRRRQVERGVWQVVCPEGPDGRRQCMRCGHSEWRFHRCVSSAVINFPVGTLVAAAALLVPEGKVCRHCDAVYPLS